MAGSPDYRQLGSWLVQLVFKCVSPNGSQATWEASDSNRGSISIEDRRDDISARVRRRYAAGCAVLAANLHGGRS